MNPFVPLLAVDWFEVIIPIVVVIIYIANHVWSAMQGGAKPNQPRPAPPPPRPRAPQPQRQAEDPAAEFLREAAKRRAAQTERETRPMRPAQPAAQPKPNRPFERARPEPLRRPAAPLVVAEAISEPAASGSVADHVRQHIDTTAFADRSSHLSHIEESTHRLDRHVQEIFDHKLGALAVSTAGSAAEEAQRVADEPQPLAARIIELMSSPDSVRQAIVMHEILDRPVNRW